MDPAAGRVEENADRQAQEVTFPRKAAPTTLLQSDPMFLLKPQM